LRPSSGILETTTELLGTQTEVLYFEDFGRRRATYTTTSIALGVEKSVSHTLRIDLPDGMSYDVDLDQKTGTKMKLPPEAAAALATAMTAGMSKDVKVKDLPEKEFLGKRCKGLEVEAMGIPTRTWTWKGLTLYSEASRGGGKPIVIKATKLTVDVAIPADKFKVPAGVEIQDVSG
jgi:hypothetical protein